MSAIINQVSRHAGIVLTATAVLALTEASSFAAKSTCDGVKVEMTKARKAEYAPLVASAMEAKIKPAQVEFGALIESGNWSAAYISTPVSDDGMMFFETVNGRKRFREVWGGWAEPSERPELAAWARKLGAPDDLAKCFAWIVTENE
ncbi:hypothetical protein T8J41_06690 [Nitratireductor rhodophyticola]|uniref:hypothetical protein n=1 Tax=Nitratireductor rhodophyticola TaxID=2854036 RepID=UPI002AC8DFE6|nr:hypothetical protein [Nitratireductor rhodophyticola]WPZ15489.1 hypothetical protein T8J41_06690 [Nitratireductor rhodophyticola]